MAGSSFILSCESTVDMPFSYVDSRGIPVLFYSYSIDGTVYEDDMLKDPDSLNRFFGFLDAGKLPRTSQINEAQYEEFFESLIKKGDVLHIAFGSGMTSSVRNAYSAAKTINEKYPDRRIEVIDSYCSSSGYGLLVDAAADLRDDGKSFEEVSGWIKDHAMRIHHQFFSTDLKYFKRSGRVSGPAAMIGSVLGICPLMRLDKYGFIKAYSKVRGKKNAIEATVEYMQEHALNKTDYDWKCFISHSNCRETALELQSRIEERFHCLKGKIRIFDIGTIISAHCGPGTTAVFFLGDERPVMD